VIGFLLASAFYARAGHNAVTTTQSFPAGLRPLIAVVDDDEAVRASLKFMLEIDGFAARTFSGADELLDCADLNAFSCIIADQVMPQMTGLSLLGELRRRGHRAPAILISSAPTETVRDLAATAGVTIVEKPLLENTLRETLHAIVTDAAPGL
jgi:FixJ family two-component response regulator